ncbi:MAG TPA: hypothetical protein VGN91_16500 [Bosea sp. (in: a-proteobacteria)]|jgi:hypothetical protein|nr:hypothetical protein [Bosea sp. (in: a-proteobacteria)]
MKSLEDIVARMERLLALLPEKQPGESTVSQYRGVHERMRRRGSYDPMECACAASYNRARAALHFCARETLLRLKADLVRQVKAGEPSQADLTATALAAYVEAVEPVILAHPPCANPDFRVASPFRAKADAPRRGAGSKKHSLKDKPADWRDQMFAATPEASSYRTAIAAMCLSPCRVGEYAETIRDQQYSPGVRVVRRDGLLLIFTIAQKSHGGKFGLVMSGVEVAIAQGGAPAAHLAQLCEEAGGAIEIAVDSTEGLRKAVGRIAARLGLSDISPNSFRAQWAADGKVTLPDPEMVAAGAGHCSIRSQSNYGRAEHGRRGGGGLVGTFSERAPRPASVQRMARFEAMRLKRAIERGRAPPSFAA